MSTLEGAQAIVTRILDGLRTKNITNIQQWQPLYNSALGLVNLASDQARITPFGARCGWCTKVTKDSRQGRCTSACDSTRNCTVTCPVPYATNSFGELPYDNPIGPYKANVSFVNETTDCSYRGFTYSTFVTKDGVSVPTVRALFTRACVCVCALGGPRLWAGKEGDLGKRGATLCCALLVWRGKDAATASAGCCRSSVWRRCAERGSLTHAAHRLNLTPCLLSLPPTPLAHTHTHQKSAKPP